MNDPKPTHPSDTDVLQAIIDTPPLGPLCSVCGEYVEVFDLDHSGQVIGGVRDVWHNRCADKRAPAYPAGTTYQSWHTNPRCPWRLDGTTEGDCCCPSLNGYLPVRMVRPGGEAKR